MVKHKPTEPEKEKFEVPTRTPKKPGIFDAVGTNRQSGEHPIREMIDFPSARDAASQLPDAPASQAVELRQANSNEVGYTTSGDSESQVHSVEIANMETIGKPTVNLLESQRPKRGQPNTRHSAIQPIAIGDTNTNISDSQDTVDGDTTHESLESQNATIGKTTGPDLDIKLSTARGLTRDEPPESC